jgi:hypothetical protein
MTTRTTSIDHLVSQALGVLGSREIHQPDYPAIVFAVGKAAQATEVNSTFIQTSAIYQLACSFNVHPTQTRCVGCSI